MSGCADGEHSISQPYRTDRIKRIGPQLTLSSNRNAADRRSKTQKTLFMNALPQTSPTTRQNEFKTLGHRWSLWILGLFMIQLNSPFAQAQSRPTPANDLFENAHTISIYESIIGQNRKATSEPGEPSHALSATTSVWWKWTASVSETV